MSKEHFEPVTVRTIAEIIVSNAYIGYTVGTNERAIVDSVEGILASHLRKPSDDEWIKNAAFLLQKAITSYDNTKSVNTDEIRRFLNKGAVTADMERVEENMGASKSVPARCEEAYYNAVDLMKKMYMEGMTSENRAKLLVLIGKSDPFKEADIVQDEKQEPQLLPFDLKAAQNGAKVVTRDGRSVKIVADDMTGTYPLLVVITNDNGSKTHSLFSKGGQFREGKSGLDDRELDLFILKEPETVYIDILRRKDGSLYTQLYKDEDEAYPVDERTNVIKTITVQI